YQGRMGVPPWIEPERYVRNSPVFYADRVTTPVLLIHGDVDWVSQEEEFFSALQRLGKRAEYVNYLGEDHFLMSPANVLDMWSRIFTWFDSNGKLSGGATTKEVGLKSRQIAPAASPSN